MKEFFSTIMFTGLAFIMIWVGIEFYGVTLSEAIYFIGGIYFIVGFVLMVIAAMVEEK